VPSDALGPGLKYDEGKARTDLLPAGAMLSVHAVLVQEDTYGETSLALVHLGRWRRGHGGLAAGAAEILLLLTHELRGDVQVGAVRGLEDVAPALLAVARVLTFGATKYGPNNWQNVTPFKDRYYAALLRHLFLRASGEVLDAESGLPHLAHAGCCALFLLSAEVGHDPT
jgi:hypothetical protein